MSEPESSVRQRKPNAGSEKETDTKEANVSEPDSMVEDEDAYSPWVDVLRVITFLFMVSCGLSYLISSGETFFWGMKNPPGYLRADWWKSKVSGPQYFTLDELAQYDGTDESKPIYLSINGSVYDVSANKRTYGPGGSYHIFSGVDASRGFVTGCFQEDRNGDMRGVEEMYLPLDDPEVDKYWSAADMAKLKEEELAKAKRRAHGALKHWTDFFAKSSKYQYVGQLKREPGWEGKKKKLCDIAQNGRTKRKIPGQEE